MTTSLIKPAALKSGDKVAAVTLSWGAPGALPYRYEIGKKQIESDFGLQVVEMANTLKAPEWIKQHPEARAQDLMQAFADPEIKGIISTIGGEDSIRMLPFIDYDVIRNNPKVFVGYSDTTVSHFICRKAGISSFYGPALMSNFAENKGIITYTKDQFQKAVFSTDVIGEIEPANQWTVEHLDWFNSDNQSIGRTMREPFGRHLLQGEGKVRGHLMGGCVQVLGMINSTEVWPAVDDWKDSIAFFEVAESDFPENMFKYWLRNLGSQGVLQNLNGIIFARAGGQKTDEERLSYDRVLHEIVRDEFKLESLPILTQMDFGHTDPVFTIPFGARAEIDCQNKKFSILEPGVS